MSKHILVTGGLGFIGSHLVRELLVDPEAIVTVVDDLSGTVLAAETIMEQIQLDRPGRLRVQFLTVEEFEELIQKREEVKQLGHAEAELASLSLFESLAPVEFETIYHLASIVGPAAVLKRAGYIAEQIVRDAYVAIRLAQRSGARLINISTSEVYGGGVNGLCREDTPRVIRGAASARQEYAAGKLAAEVAIENLCRERRLDAVTIRPFNVAGIRQSGRGGFVLPRFIAQAILEEPLTVFGDGRQVRAFTDVRDVASGLLLAARLGKCGGTYNVGNSASRTSIGELAERVVAITGSHSEILHVDPKALYGNSFADAADKFPDAGELMALGWRPRYALLDTIHDTYRYMRDLPEDELLTLAGLSAESAPVPIFA